MEVETVKTVVIGLTVIAIIVATIAIVVTLVKWQRAGRHDEPHGRDHARHRTTRGRN